MRGAHVRQVAAVSLLAAVFAACGESKQTPKPAPGKVVRGDTETGMKLKLETFVAPRADPVLKRLDAYRAAGGYPAVDYHRATADNTKGQVADRIRTITFAPDQNAIAAGKGAAARFACDALRYEWPPQRKATQQTYDGLIKTVCAVPPTSQDGVKAGSRAVYYLVTDRTFGERGIRTQRIYGPRSEELK
jgi:hypothetical protein